MNRTESSRLFDTFAELRQDVRTVEALPLISSLFFLHTVEQFHSYFAARGMVLPEGAAAELGGLVLSTRRVAAHVKATLGDRVRADFRMTELINLDEGLIARTSRHIKAFVSRIAEGQGGKDFPYTVGSEYSYLLDYVTRQFSKETSFSQTPRTLAEVMVELAEIRPGMKVLDFTAGLARTLVEVSRQQVKQGHDPDDLTYVAQEVMTETAVLGAIHLAVNGVTNFTVYAGDTLLEPATRLGDFDRVLADPPISLLIPHLVGRLQKDPRFTFGKSMPKNADWAFLQHGLTALKPGGRAVFVTAHGPMFRGASEAALRHDLLSSGWLNTVMALPSALYPNLGLPVVLTVFDRPAEGKGGFRDVLMVDASQRGEKEGRMRVLDSGTQEDLVEAFQKRQTGGTNAALVDNNRIHANNDVWQPSQYLEAKSDDELDLKQIQAELKAAQKELAQATEELNAAMAQLDRP